jgi:hypothetical protein
LHVAGDASKSFWTEAALRVQRQSIHVTVAEHAAERPRPHAEPKPVKDEVRRQPKPERRKSIRRAAPPLAPALVPTDDELKLRLAEELDYARRLLDQMGDSLSSDTNLLLRHGVSLQSVDIVGQIIGHVANVIRSGNPDAAVEDIGMAELKGRLKRRRIG